MSRDDSINGVYDALHELQNDTTIPKNVKSKIEGIMLTLISDNELPIKVNKALNDFDEIVNDINLKPYTRTQIWNIVSMLEVHSK